jgi:nicotinamidase-related amidase
MKNKKDINSFKKSILLIIDPQKDFINPNGLYPKNHKSIDNILKAKIKIQKLMDSQLKLKKIIVFSSYKQNQFKENYSICIPGTDGHEIDLIHLQNVLLFEKTSHNVLSSIKFELFIKNEEIEFIYLAGFLTEYCIFESAIQFLNNGISLYLLEDCIATADDSEEKGRFAMNDLTKKGAKISHSKSFIESFV